jgi:hypothetical protein
VVGDKLQVARQDQHCVLPGRCTRLRRISPPALASGPAVPALVPMAPRWTRCRAAVPRAGSRRPPDEAPASCLLERSSRTDLECAPAEWRRAARARGGHPARPSPARHPRASCRQAAAPARMLVISRVCACGLRLF